MKSISVCDRVDLKELQQQVRNHWGMYLEYQEKTPESLVVLIGIPNDKEMPRGMIDWIRGYLVAIKIHQVPLMEQHSEAPGAVRIIPTLAELAGAYALDSAPEDGSSPGFKKRNITKG